MSSLLEIIRGDNPKSIYGGINGTARGEFAVRLYSHLEPIAPELEQHPDILRFLNELLTHVGTLIEEAHLPELIEPLGAYFATAKVSGKDGIPNTIVGLQTMLGVPALSSREATRAEQDAAVRAVAANLMGNVTHRVSTDPYYSDSFTTFRSTSPGLEVYGIAQVTSSNGLGVCYAVRTGNKEPTRYIGDNAMEHAASLFKRLSA